MTDPCVKDLEEAFTTLQTDMAVITKEDLAARLTKLEEMVANINARLTKMNPGNEYFNSQWRE